ncbi:MAG: peptidoglycan-binding domain-containing protein [Methylovirgula sp.]
MREALARSDNDFVVAEPRGRRAPRKDRFGRLGSVLRLIVQVAAYPNRILGGLVFAITIAILVNALMLQHSRHPAPLFHKTITVPVPDETPAAPAPQPEAAAPAAAVPAPAVAGPPAPHPARDPIGQLLKTEAPAGTTASEPERPKPAPHHHEAKAAGTDGIAQLLKADSDHEAAEDRPKTVAAAQQALVKLGFVVRPDGHMGAVTRHALEQFERDHGLPVDGKLTPKLLRKLAAESGIPIE